MRRLVLVFLDGVGIGPNDPDSNPFLQADLPWLRGALGGIPTLERPELQGAGAVAFPLDALLGVEGTPQSGTGQTSLLTGRNAAELFGRHFGPWAPVSLRTMLAEENVLRRALDAGLSAAFANAYPRDWPSGKAARWPAASPLAARSAGLLTRHAEHLARGEAVASEIENERWRKHVGPGDLPRVSPFDAGANLARVSSTTRLTFFAHYSTDYAGHRAAMAGCVRALQRVDAFLGGLAAADPEALVLVTSDHGNIEDVREGHTRNPTLGVAAGPGAAEFRGELSSIMDVAPAVLAWLAQD